MAGGDLVCVWEEGTGRAETKRRSKGVVYVYKGGSWGWGMDEKKKRLEKRCEEIQQDLIGFIMLTNSGRCLLWCKCDSWKFILKLNFQCNSIKRWGPLGGGISAFTKVFKRAKFSPFCPYVHSACEKTVLFLSGDHRNEAPSWKQGMSPSRYGICRRLDLGLPSQPPELWELNVYL